MTLQLKIKINNALYAEFDQKTDLIKAYIHNKQQLISTTTKHYQEVS